MLIRALVKDTKTNNFCIENYVFYIFKRQLHKFQEYFTAFGFLTNAPGTLVISSQKIYTMRLCVIMLGFYLMKPLTNMKRHMCVC
jgi:hypothetical protein